MDTPDQLAPLPKAHVRGAIAQLMWGLVLIAIDIDTSVTIGGLLFPVDLIPDAIGWSLIALAVFALSHEDGGAGYADRMQFLKWASLIALANSLAPWEILPLLNGVEELAGLLTIVGGAILFRTLEGLCRRHQLPESAARWRRTYLSFLVLYALPVGLLRLLGFLLVLGVFPPVDFAFEFDNPAAVIMVLSIFAMPAVFALRAGYVMRGELAAARGGSIGGDVPRTG